MDWDRVVEKIDIRASGDCWEWEGWFFNHGYGAFYTTNKSYLAHRLAYEYFYDQPPGDLCVLHRCDNPPCCNPYHLFLGTREDNARDRDAKGRGVVLRGEAHGRFGKLKTHCPAGHEYTEENSYRNGRGRSCRTCRRERKKLRHA